MEVELNKEEMKAALSDFLIINAFAPGKDYMINDELQMDAWDEYSTFKCFRIKPNGEIKIFRPVNGDWLSAEEVLS